MLQCWRKEFDFFSDIWRECEDKSVGDGKSSVERVGKIEHENERFVPVNRVRWMLGNGRITLVDMEENRSV
jgi:hypothetical protein